MRDDEQINVRIPPDLRDWLRQQKERNRSSLSSEVTRAIAERRDRCEKQSRKKAA